MIIILTFFLSYIFGDIKVGSPLSVPQFLFYSFLLNQIAPILKSNSRLDLELKLKHTFGIENLCFWKSNSMFLSSIGSKSSTRQETLILISWTSMAENYKMTTNYPCLLELMPCVTRSPWVWAGLRVCSESIYYGKGEGMSFPDSVT